MAAERRLPLDPDAGQASSGQNLRSPDKAALFLADAELTMLDISRLRLTGAELAYLSSCEGATAGPDLPDEAIHLTGALQIAGYRGVIATLWTVSDSVAPEVAAHVYTALTHNRNLDTAHAATALHHALRDLRTTRQPLIWAAYCHTGV